MQGAHLCLLHCLGSRSIKNSLTVMVDGIRNVPFASSCSICCLLFRGKTFPFVAVFTLLVLVSIADTIGAAAFRNICHTLSPFSSCPEPRIETVFRDADASAYPQDTEFGGAVAQVVGRAQAEQGFFKLILFFNPTDLEHQRVKTGQRLHCESPGLCRCTYHRRRCPDFSDYLLDGG